VPPKPASFCTSRPALWSLMRPIFDMITDQIRQLCETVAEEARFVRIAFPRIADYAASLPLEELRTPAIHPERHYLGHGDATAAFFITLDAINFGSGYFPHLKKRSGMSGYFTVASCLTDHFNAHGPLTADALIQLTAEDCAEIFQQTKPDEAVGELMQLFAMALNNLGRYLIESFAGSFSRLITSAGQSALHLIEILRAMKFFEDVQPYRGRRIPFFKRAQLTAADLSLALGGEELGRFHDLHQLTIFADNLVPHVLRMDGILQYDPGLAARIDREERIPASSEEEVELRAAAVHASELIVRWLRANGHDRITAMNVDYLLWHRGQHPQYKQAKPRHRTRTVYY
jgi:hypothetical protein